MSKCGNYALEVDESDGVIRLHVWSIRASDVNLHISLDDDAADSLAFRLGVEIQEHDIVKLDNSGHLRTTAGRT